MLKFIFDWIAGMLIIVQTREPARQTANRHKQPKLMQNLTVSHKPYYNADAFVWVDMFYSNALF